MGTQMTFTTYENDSNRHVTIHRGDCGQIRKRGGQHKYHNGRYNEFSTYQAASAYAHHTTYPVKDCSFCKPTSPARARKYPL